MSTGYKYHYNTIDSAASFSFCALGRNSHSPPLNMEGRVIQV